MISMDNIKQQYYVDDENNQRSTVRRKERAREKVEAVVKQGRAGASRGKKRVVCEKVRAQSQGLQRMNRPARSSSTGGRGGNPIGRGFHIQASLSH